MGVVLRALLVLGALLLSRSNISILRSGPSPTECASNGTLNHPDQTRGRQDRQPARKFIAEAQSVVRHVGHIRFFFTLLWFTN
jgi:hypothetical protein